MLEMSITDSQSLPQARLWAERQSGSLLPANARSRSTSPRTRTGFAGRPPIETSPVSSTSAEILPPAIRPLPEPPKAVND
jgi:hypothetical protein